MLEGTKKYSVFRVGDDPWFSGEKWVFMTSIKTLTLMIMVTSPWSSPREEHKTHNVETILFYKSDSGLGFNPPITTSLGDLGQDT